MSGNQTTEMSTSSRPRNLYIFLVFTYSRALRDENKLRPSKIKTPKVTPENRNHPDENQLLPEDLHFFKTETREHLIRLYFELLMSAFW